MKPPAALLGKDRKTSGGMRGRLGEVVLSQEQTESLWA